MASSKTIQCYLSQGRIRAGDRKNEDSKGAQHERTQTATVEPVFGVLTQYLAMRKVMSKGIHNANKQFKMAAIAYNLKKYLKFENRPRQTQRNETSLSIVGMILALIDWIGQVRPQNGVFTT